MSNTKEDDLDDMLLSDVDQEFDSKLDDMLLDVDDLAVPSFKKAISMESQDDFFTSNLALGVSRKSNTLKNPKLSNEL